MPTKNGKNLTEDEIWDDSALIASWDEALAEYKYYHSIHARGENVSDVLAREGQEGEKGDQDKDQGGDGIGAAEASGSEDGEVIEAPIMPPVVHTTLENHDMNSTEAAPQREKPAGNLSLGVDGSRNGADSLPQAVMGAVHDDGLKNLMMSWYYAGYYTGLHEGRQLAR
ncbi:MAG: hypothetical protein M1826_006515 [Phylliscum demangeonii]|nr:MAG: hypothetical protein M1826_006515 [Phylliscum demangeonii]